MDCKTQLASLAIEELDKGDFLMATKILTTGIRIEPNNHELYFERSICHHKLGDFKASLDDANAAIRLNSADYNIHYQKGLALIGLSMFPEAVTSFKKAIELRAKQDDSKLSDIFKLLRDATNELNTARRRLPNHQSRNDTVPMPANQTNTMITGDQTKSNDPVDSTTDRPLIQPGPSSNHSNNTNTINISNNNNHITPMGGFLIDNNNNGNNNLVATNRNININNQAMSSLNQVFNGSIRSNRVVSSTANHHQNNNDSLSSSINQTSHHSDISNPHSNLANMHSEQAKAQFEWNIRRSERIFLHNTNEAGTSVPQYGVVAGPGNFINLQRQQGVPNLPPMGGKNIVVKRVLDNHDQTSTYQPNIMVKPQSGDASSLAGSDLDVGDSYISALTSVPSSNNHHDVADSQKRLLVTPSSCMPATSQGPSTSTSTGTKDDSYSSKYKRLRRDRERARRGTSKLCTIKQSDLEELNKPSNNIDSSRRFMRVIAPIDGWLYSGQLSIDGNNSQGITQYVVKLDGDSTESSYLFNQDTVLNDVIKEVRVKTVSELRKGARICCYWSRQYKCLSTGVVTSRTFEATKSLVSVKYDNGDLSALPLEDLRLLPPDYPKYMSNCDPLLLTRNGDGNAGVNVNNAAISTSNNNNSVNHDEEHMSMNDCRSSSEGASSNTKGFIASIQEKKSIEHDVDQNNCSGSSISSAGELPKVVNDMDTILPPKNNSNPSMEKQEMFSDSDDNENTLDNGNEDSTIPPTNETIDLFISEDTDLKQQDENHNHEGRFDMVSITKDNALAITNETQIITNNNSNRESVAEEKTFGLEYRPWMFEGPPKRNKRHGRIYRQNYSSIRRGNEVIRIGDSAELMPRDESILPFIAKIDGMWATSRGEMRVSVKWYYRLIETEGEPYELRDGENALFETDHSDENDVQSIFRSTKIISWADYSKNNLGHVNDNNDTSPKIFYLAGYYDPIRRTKNLRPEVKEAHQR